MCLSGVIVRADLFSIYLPHRVMDSVLRLAYSVWHTQNSFNQPNGIIWAKLYLHIVWTCLHRNTISIFAFLLSIDACVRVCVCVFVELQHVWKPTTEYRITSKLELHIDLSPDDTVFLLCIVTNGFFNCFWTTLLDVFRICALCNSVQSSCSLLIPDGEGNIERKGLCETNQMLCSMSTFVIQILERYWATEQIRWFSWSSINGLPNKSW